MMDWLKNLFADKGTSSAFKGVDSPKSPQSDVEMDDLSEVANAISTDSKIGALLKNQSLQELIAQSRPGCYEKGQNFFQESRRTKQKHNKQQNFKENDKLRDLLSADVSNQLMEYFDFSREERQHVRRSGNLVQVFLSTLIKERIIKPHDVTPLVHGLNYLGQRALASDVEKMFRISTGIGNRLHGLTNERNFRSLRDALRRKYLSQCKAVKPFIGLLESRCINDIFVERKIEMLIANTAVGGLEIWKELDTHHNIVAIASNYGSVSIEGNTGYGKSMLMFQLAYDWCEATGTSPISELDLLIFLQCEKVCKDETIYQSIKNMLPESSALSTDVISNAIHSCSSVMVILDDVDKLIQGNNMELSKFIGNGATSTKFSVVMTSQPGILPSYNPEETKRVRLCGFDSRAKQHYIRKVLANNNESLSEDIFNKISANVALGNLCTIPSLFSTFARVATQQNYPYNAHTITSVFRHMPLYLVSHNLSENRIESSEINTLENYIRLSKVAYDTLTNRKETMLWGKQELIKVLGEDCYKMSTSCGILQEQNFFLLKTDCQPPDFDNSTRRTDVRFCHDIFCEWYAACYIHELVKNSAPLTYLTCISPVKFSNVFRFFCGLNPPCATKVIEYLETTGEAGKTFSLLCRLEQFGTFQEIKSEVRNICKHGVTFTKDGSRLLQNSMIEIVELASRKEISLTLLSLRNCINFDRSCEGRLVLSSDAVLSSHTLKYVKTLQITEQVRRLDHQQLENIMNFAKQCDGLKVLRFIECLPPQTFDQISTRACYDFLVLWISKMKNTYQLNHTSGKWERDGKELQEIDYNYEVHYFEMNSYNATPSDNKELMTHTSPVSRKRPRTSTFSNNSD